jgi:pyruvate dehydrogenase E1 component alpha subunit
VLEAVTYRYRGHSVADAGLAYRSKEEIAEHRAHDPIERVRARLLESGTPAEELERVAATARERVAAAVEHAEHAAEPSVADLAAGMHAAGSAKQFERMRPGSAFGEQELTFDAGLGR